MKRIRLLPLVLIAISALLAVKVLGFVMGVEQVAVGPRPAVAAGSEGGHGEAAAEAAPAGPDTSAVDRLTAPVDLGEEYKKLKAEQEKGGGHGEAASGHGEAAPAAEAAAPAADAHGAAPAADAHGAAPAADAHGAAPAAEAHGAAPAADANAAAPAADAHGAAPAADANAAAPAADAHGAAPAAEGHAAPAEGGHGAAGKGKSEVYTERPKEYSPPIGSSERAILEGLSVRRDELDKREEDITLRTKLLEAAEKRLTDRINQLQSIESQLGVATDGAPAAGGPPAGAPASAGATQTPPAPATGAPATGGKAAGAAAPATEQMTALVSLYEGMKPKSAAAVFDKLETGTLLELVGRMNPRKLAPIIAAMDPDKASRITGLMVGAQQAPKRVVVQVEQLGSDSAMLPPERAVPPLDATALPQIMPAAGN